jgi:predicted MFS family arabinose efflux permease
VQIIGSAVAGSIIATLGAEAAFAFNAFTFLLSAALLLFLPVPPGRAVTTRGWRGFIDDAQGGLIFARHDPFISRLVIVQALASLSVGATSALLVVLAQQHYHLPPSGFASFILTIGVGALIGPFLLTLLTRDVRHPKWLFGPYIIRGIGDILIAVTTSVPFAWFLLFVYGLNTSSGMVTFQTWTQRKVPDLVRGRVFTLLDVVWNVMKIISLGIGAWLAERFGVQVVYYLGGAMLYMSGILDLILIKPDTNTSS